MGCQHIVIAAFLLFTACASIVPSTIDENSFSNLDELTTTHFDLSIHLDFTNNSISGIQTLFMSVLKDHTDHIDLDIKNVNVTAVSEDSIGQLPFHVRLPAKDVTGQQLRIYLPEAVNTSKQLIVKIEFTSTNPSASSWLTPEQTASKILPYLYTQCQPVYCRSIAPFQDSPFVKSTYTAKVSVINPVVVHLSADLLESFADPIRLNHTIYSFSMTIPIPSYLFTIVAGNLIEVKLGARTAVVSEPTFIESYAWELSDLELYLTTLESITTPYEWGSYKIVIMPPSFPYGGMENPLVTFASPSIISGDKSCLPVAIHEIAHSWTGNLVTCKNWANLWINEGLTKFLERKANKKLYGEQFYLINANVGNDRLNDAIASYGKLSNYTSLHPLVKGTNPDDSFSQIPYEKGFQFMVYIESLVGETILQNFLREYIIKFRYTSIDFLDFKEFLITVVHETMEETEATNVLGKIEWDAWIFQPGVSPVLVDFYTPVISQVKDLA